MTTAQRGDKLSPGDFGLAQAWPLSRWARKNKKGSLSAAATSPPAVDFGDRNRLATFDEARGNALCDRLKLGYDLFCTTFSRLLAVCKANQSQTRPRSPKRRVGSSLSRHRTRLLLSDSGQSAPTLARLKKSAAPSQKGLAFARERSVAVVAPGGSSRGESIRAKSPPNPAAERRMAGSRWCSRRLPSPWRATCRIPSSPTRN
jgi:hypothetical protein